MATKLARAIETANLWRIEHDKRVRENRTLRVVYVRAKELHEVLSDLEFTSLLCKTDATQIGTQLELLKQSLNKALFAAVPGEDPFDITNAYSDSPETIEEDDGKVVDN